MINYTELSINAAKKAVEREAVENLAFANIRMSGNKKISIRYGFYSAPSEDDLEALSLIETEIYAETWRWLDDILTEWELLSELHVVCGETVIYNNIA